ncbi:CHAT domain-containing protein [Gymnopilus junonius]|uniref:CHAT domain-containing protein n=1 Tax=Gymnopilus junonius TaxID=109634 RepID=A0A9P5NCG5_GYMJU|nr:CHAT domain-containing protein [Gymnopilus junonius]
MSENLSLPRIWWCCTGPFSVLPIHAAGLYTSFGPQLRLSDFTVSSYITSLSLFISCPPADPPADFKLLIIAQPSTPDLPPLPGVTAEASNIKGRANSLKTIELNGERATSAAVMRESASAPWVHAACHGRQSGIWSSFALHDGLLQLQMLASLPGLSQAEFAFLSTCEMAMGDGHLSGEALHLAGSLHRLGYHSVIATLFSVRDRDAPFIANKVYEQLFKDERLNYRKAAQALHCAIHLLQEANG